jgi:sugar lactone lactonase YvrE
MFASRLLAALVALLIAALSPLPPRAHSAPAIQVLATVGGQPDDITVDPQGRLVWGDLAAGTVDRLAGGRVSVIARGLSVPEGVLVLSSGAIIVAEQGLDRIDRISRTGTNTAIHALAPVPGQEGVDGIGRDAKTGDLLVPDSPRGTVLRMGPNGRHARIIAAGLGRPVDAATDAHGNVLVPDEHLGTLVMISPRGRISYRGSFSTPDDVAATVSGTVWVTSLGDGGLWELLPNAAPRRILSGLANPQGLTLDRCGDPIVVDQSSARILRVLLTSRSSRCPV